MQRAIVIGGGVVGLACAIELQRRGLAVTLVERDADPRGASWGNAGHIATEQVEPLASMATLRSFPRRLFWRGGALSLPPGAWRRWLPFALRLVAASRHSRFAAGKDALRPMLAQALPAWRRLLDRAGARALLREGGHIVVWETPASAERGTAHWRAADIGETRVEELRADALRGVQALVSVPLAGGIRFSGSGQIEDPGLLAEALRTAFAKTGGALRLGEVAAVGRGEADVEVRLADGETLSAEIVVVAAGADSARLMTPLGHRVPLIAERGYHIQAPVAEGEWPPATPPIVFEDRSMIVTRFRSGLRAASFVEFATIERPADSRKWARLKRHAATLGLPLGDAPREWMGARPTLPDYLPAIGRSETLPGLFYAFGHQHLGLTLSACTGEAIGALVAGAAPPFDLAPFDLARFG